MKRSDVFEVREPPPYGWTRLKASLDERQRARWPWALVALGALAVMLLIMAMPRGRAVAPEVQRATLAAIEVTSRGYVGEPVAMRAESNGAVLRVPSDDPQVVMYRVAMLSSDDAPPTE
jgi:hypothetical protein